MVCFHSKHSTGVLEVPHKNAKGLEATISDLALIIGQRPVKTRAIPTKRRLAMEQFGNTNFVPFAPFPPDYFAQKDKQQADGTESTHVPI
ncbi:zinc finger protein [Sesbania bispinosa]|nr:zinc finger protein [Sesbania bispinosa]